MVLWADCHLLGLCVLLRDTLNASFQRTVIADRRFVSNMKFVQIFELATFFVCSLLLFARVLFEFVDRYVTRAPNGHPPYGIDAELMRAKNVAVRNLQSARRLLESQFRSILPTGYSLR